MTITTAFLTIFAFLIIFFITLKILRIDVGFNFDKFLLLLVLFFPLGLVMDFVHEFGHAVWGIAAGGRLTYIQVAYFEIYPKFAMTSQFLLGRVEVEGLTGFNYGLFLLGGSITTNIVSWLLATVLLKMKLGLKMQFGLRILGFFGLLDLLLYVVLPQFGLQHWIFLGGYNPEPLIGARMMNIPDLAFYMIIFFTTLALVYLYFKPLAKKTWNRTKNLLNLN